MSETDKISSLLKLIAANVIYFRKRLGMTQDDLAEVSGMDRTYIGYIENAKQNISLSKLVDLSNALNITLEILLSPNSESLDGQTDIEKLNIAFPYLREFQKLANKYDINDVFQDNGGKLLQVLLVTGLTNIKSREGNDAIDANGKQFELKSVNVSLTNQFSTHHHLNPKIIAKYRLVDWIFCVYESIELKEIYYVTPDKLEPWFKKYEDKWNIDQKDGNNPKIPLKLVKEIGKLIFTTPQDGQLSRVTL
jgi:transcriptional regulator with XRE-family HTH domain